MIDQPTAELSERELEILRLVATGAGNKEIAQVLTISTNTVKVHLRNIFTKISVTSRTEAAMYAVRIGLVESANRVAYDSIVVEDTAREQMLLETVVGKTLSLDGHVAPGKSLRQINLWIVIVLVAIAGILGLGGAMAWQSGRSNESNQPPSATTIPRWQIRANMLVARSSVASVAYENHIYVIGGLTSEGVTSASEQYDPVSNAWKLLSPKPVAVEKVSAAVIGGSIYIPGGCNTADQPSDIMEVYDPRLDRWSRAASLPQALCGYALATFEGRLYIFGGWDGNHALNTVYEYDPERDIWQQRTSMSIVRAYAQAAVSQGSIFILGGYNGQKALDNSDIYQPEKDISGLNPWSKAKPLPEARYDMGVVSVADLLYVIGGKDDSGKALDPWIYFPQEGRWSLMESKNTSKIGDNPGIVYLGGNIYVIGGSFNSVPNDQILSYQAVYNLAVPLIIK